MVAVGLQYLQYARGLFRPVRLDSVFLFVTSTCNSRCRTCFYWEELNQGRDLSFDQLEKVSGTAPPFPKLWISGGEPFLRKELAEIIELFYVNNGVRQVNLPTNGLLPGKTEAVITHLLEHCPELAIDLNFSLDGLANTHDAIRGVPNNFRKTLDTIRLAEAKWKNVRRLRRNVVTVITSENYDELAALGMALMQRADIDGHYFAVVRGNPRDAALKQLSSAELAQLHRKLMWFHERYADKLFARVPSPARQLGRAYYLGTIRLHFDVHERNHQTNRPWPMACTAGRTTIVIDHDGHFRACEMRDKLGRLQDFEFDLSAALNSVQMQREIEAIPAAQCWCTHSCWLQTSTRFSPKVMLFHIPWAYMKHRWNRLRHLGGGDLEPFCVTDAPAVDKGDQSRPA